MPFEFRQQDVSLQYDAEPGLAVRIRERVRQQERDADLNVNVLLSQPDVLILQSATGSTLVEVHADRAVMRTRYFDEFTAADAHEGRADYTRRKARRLLDLLDAAGAKLLLVGIVSVARMEVPSGESPNALREHFRERFGGINVLTEGALPFDFVLRASRIADEARYSNVQLSWYQDRTFTLTMDTLAPARTVVKQVSDWELPLTGEGLELRYDQNNKRGLHAGRRDWSAADMSALIDRYLDDLPNAVRDITNLLARTA